VLEPATPARVTANKQQIQQFHKSAYEEYKSSVSPPIDDTCMWLLEEPTYLSWLQSPSSSVLWISGDPGCGKTTLAAFLIERIRQYLSSQEGDSTVVYFFLDATVAAQGDGMAVLFALIHQLLKANPALAPLVQKHLAPNNSQMGLSLHNLCEIFRAIISSRERTYRHVVCVLDAIDECETASMTKVMKCFSSVISCCGNDGTDDGLFKLAVTSRCTHAIDDLFRAVPPRHKISLSEHAAHTARDIMAFILARCARVQSITHCSDAVRCAVEKRLVARSDNTFLWIYLVLDLLESATDASPQAFDAVLCSVPDKLDGLYNSILRRSAAPDALIRVLSVIAASRRALTMDEIDIALAVAPDDTGLWQVQQRRQFDIARRLYAVRGLFIRITNGTVSFIHQTAAEFLVRSPEVPRPPAGGLYQYRACLDEIQINKCLAEICVVYLSLSDSAVQEQTTCKALTDISDDDSDGDGGHRLTEVDLRQNGSTTGLFEYAAKHWGTHCCLGNISSISSYASLSTDTHGRKDDELLAQGRRPLRYIHEPLSCLVPAVLGHHQHHPPISQRTDTSNHCIAHWSCGYNAFSPNQRLPNKRHDSTESNPTSRFGKVDSPSLGRVERARKQRQRRRRVPVTAAPRRWR